MNFSHFKLEVKTKKTFILSNNEIAYCAGLPCYRYQLGQSITVHWHQSESANRPTAISCQGSFVGYKTYFLFIYRLLFYSAYGSVLSNNLYFFNMIFKNRALYRPSLIDTALLQQYLVSTDAA